MKNRTKVAILIALMTGLAAVVVFQILRPPLAIDLRKRSARVFSQSGEDGIIAAIFEVIQPTTRFAVEFGCSDGLVNSNVRNLIVNQGWSGLLMDGNDRLIETAKKNYTDFPKAKIVSAWVYPGNVEILFEENGVPKDLDMLVIDIDSNDFYVWRAIHDFRPKLVVIEYNGNYPPPLKRVVRFHPLNYWDDSDYFGASIQSFYELGKKKGYELVYANELNLFFVDEKYYSRFGIANNSPQVMYRPPHYGGAQISRYGFPLGKGGGSPDGYGHPAWDKFEVEVDGKKVKPFDKDLTWEKVTIQKKWVELP